MMLLTKAIKRALPALYATENIPILERIIICKFFMPSSNYTWYVLEGEPLSNGDYTFFGIVLGHYPKLGYFNYFELLKCRGQLGFNVERDQSVFKVPCKKLLAKEELACFVSKEELQCLP